MIPGPFGVPVPDWVEALRDRPPPVPSRLLDWEFRFCEPSYRAEGKWVSRMGSWRPDFGYSQARSWWPTQGRYDPIML